MNRFTLINPSSNEFIMRVNTFNVYTGEPGDTMDIRPGDAGTFKIEANQSYSVKPVEVAVA